MNQFANLKTLKKIGDEQFNDIYEFDYNKSNQKNQKNKSKSLET